MHINVHPSLGHGTGTRGNNHPTIGQAPLKVGFLLKKYYKKITADHQHIFFTAVIWKYLEYIRFFSKLDIVYGISFIGNIPMNLEIVSQHNYHGLEKKTSKLNKII